eukprot:TRINITY_DN33416_c1_g1_i1.p1 TRINITY_DN33416_c1_g1~~TRINITY_DN33416_c1_g1_i1.p1  ORF type:complete len:170 (+),score=28.60 TRINITY_DN33416_c1_g1_i1:41-550(+)
MSREVYFGKAIQAIFKNWSGLQLAIQQGAGGHQNLEKEIWLMASSENWFRENPGLLGCEVADFLDEILQREFDLILEDGSLEEVGELLVQYHALCASSSEAEIIEKLQKLPRCDLSLCKCEDEEDEKLHRSLNSMQANMESMEVSEEQPREPEVDEDGFQMVASRRKKR